MIARPSHSDMTLPKRARGPVGTPRAPSPFDAFALPLFRPMARKPLVRRGPAIRVPVTWKENVKIEALIEKIVVKARKEESGPSHLDFKM